LLTPTPPPCPPRRNRNGYLDATEIGELFEDLEQTEEKNKFLIAQLVSMCSRAIPWLAPRSNGWLPWLPTSVQHAASHAQAGRHTVRPVIPQ